MERVYLDNAATSWPKPEAVYDAVQEAMRELGAPAGRSGYREAAAVERHLLETRRLAAKLLGAADPRRIILTFNATDSLNLALHGLLAAGDHVVTTDVEHNSVLRPLRDLQERLGIAATHVPCDAAGLVDHRDVAAAIRPETALIALTHASNVTGAVQPAREIGQLAAERGIPLLLDAAQTAGHWPVDVEQLGCSLLAAPGHKGLMGPLGVGLLYVAPGMELRLRSIRQGGTGTTSESDLQPQTLPDKYESGNHNVPAILGLRAGLEFVLQRGVEQLQHHQQQLTQRLLDGLRRIPTLTVLGPRDSARQVGVVSVTLKGYDPQEIAGMLDSSFRIQVRSGLHCAPRIHRAMGTLQQGGTVRMSVGPFNSVDHIDLALEAWSQLASSQVA